MPVPSWSSENRERPLVVERADLGVEHGVGRACPELCRSRSRLEALGQVVAVPARQRGLTARDRHERAEAVPLGLVDPALAPGKRFRRGREHGRVPARALLRAVLAQEEPVLRIPVELRGHERPDAVQPLPLQANRQTAVPLLLDELVRAAIPDLDGSGAVLAGRDRALEVAVLERVILDVHGEMPLAPAKWNALRHRPACQCAVSLETKVVVQPSRIVALDDEARLRGTPLLRAERLGRLPGAALAAVFVERHLWIVAINATLSSPTGRRFEEIPAQRAFLVRG